MIKKIVKYIYNRFLGVELDIKSNVPLKILQPKRSQGFPLLIINSSFNDVSFGIGCKLSHCLCLGNIELGNFVSIYGPGTVLSSILGKIVIGNFCSIGQNVSIQESYHNYNNPTNYLIGKNIFRDNSIKDFITKGDIVISDDVWIGSNSVILSGVTIGRGAIIAAGSIVSKDVGSYEIWGGNPAKFIRKRFDDKDIEYLEQSKWWTWDVNKIKNSKQFFSTQIKY